MGSNSTPRFEISGAIIIWIQTKTADAGKASAVDRKGSVCKMTDRTVARVAQELPLTSAEKTYANETPEQQAKHKEIALRVRRQKGPFPKRALFPNLRKSELERLFVERWGNALPDDDAGRADLRLMVDHLAQLSVHHITGWVSTWASWLSDDELDDLIAVVGPGKHWTAIALGKELNLDDAMRTRLKIRTIGAVDCTKAKRARRCKKQEAAAARARRAKAGAAPHALSEAHLKPWLALDVSESTYRRKKRQADSVDSDSSGILLESQCVTNRCHGGPSPTRGGVLARAAAGDLPPMPAINTASTVYADRVEPVLKTEKLEQQKRETAKAARCVSNRIQERKTGRPPDAALDIGHVAANAANGATNMAHAA